MDVFVAGFRTTTSSATKLVAATVCGLSLGVTVVENVRQYCATVGIDHVAKKNVIGGFNQTFDTNGEIHFTQFVPAKARGRAVWVQAALPGTCPEDCVSNLVGAFVE